MIKRIQNSLQKAFLRFRLKAKTQVSEKFRPQQKLILIILTLGIVSFLWEKNRESSVVAVPESAKSVDTYIPAGFVLVPIQLTNAEALDSMIGSTGVVDLFIPDLKKGRSKKVAEHIKILRAPLNPNQFAVLVSERASGQLVHYEGAYFAVVQNPKTLGMQIETSTKRKLSSRLIMEETRETR